MTERLSAKRLHAIAENDSCSKLSRQMALELLELLELRTKLAEWPWPLDAGLSWSGFCIAGDEKSIAEVKRLISVEARAEDLQKMLEAKKVQQ